MTNSTNTTKKIAAKEAKDKFGQLLDTARSEPVTIQKKGRDVAVVMSVEQYQRFEAIEDAYWLDEATKASKKGFLGTKESEKLLKSMLHAKD